MDGVSYQKRQKEKRMKKVQESCLKRAQRKLVSINPRPIAFYIIGQRKALCMQRLQIQILCEELNFLHRHPYKISKW